MAKGKPIGVRFDVEMLAVLKEDEGIESPQKALNFLSCFWRDNRNGQAELKEALDKLAEITEKQTNKPNPAPETKKTTESPKKEKEPQQEAKNGSGLEFMGHLIPKGLKGIELSIWKAEIREALKPKNT